MANVYGSRVITAAMEADAEILRLELVLAAKEQVLAQVRDAHDNDLRMIALLRAEIEVLKQLLDPTPTPPTTALIGSSTELGFPVDVPSMGTYRHYMGTAALDGARQPTYATQAGLVQAYDRYGVRTVILSWKTHDAAKQAKFYASCPPDLRFLVAAHHEHNDNIRDGSLTYGAYTDLCYRVAESAHVAGHQFGPIHNGSNREFGATGAWGYWIDEWVRVEAPLAVCDFWGFDTYAKKYQPPADKLGPVLEYAKGHGLPLVIGETASPYDDAAAQAAWAGLMLV